MKGKLISTAEQMAGPAARAAVVTFKRDQRETLPPHTHTLSRFDLPSEFIPFVFLVWFGFLTFSLALSPSPSLCFF